MLWVGNTPVSLGWHDSVSLVELVKAYLDIDGSLKVEIKLEVVSTTKYTT